MSHPVIPDDARPCLWMSAGLLTYRLCDRDFDCDRCPLDAALRRGDLRENDAHEALLKPNHDTGDFPEDRYYTAGHCWVQAVQGQDRGCQRRGKVRFGLDAFAAAIIGQCGGITWTQPGSSLASGETVCQIDLGLGVLWIGAPVRGSVARENPTLRDRPEQLVTEPYTAGWIAELAAENMDDLDQLTPALRSRERTRMDLQRFRRRVAMQLLADDADRVGRTMADGGELLTDLRQMLGGPKYLDIVRELIH
jgi:glycine cleavage system H lipoate-binding protein